MMNIKLTSIARRMMVHHSTKHYCLCSQDHFIYKYIYATAKLEKMCRLPAKSSQLHHLLKDKIARSWPFSKLNNSIGIGHVTELPDGTLLILYDQLYYYDPTAGTKVAVAKASLKGQGIATPLRGGIAVHPVSGHAYFGEYKNDRKTAIDIYRIADKGRRIERCYRFKAGEIKHVHGIFWDKHRHRLWITTGDDDQQCGFYFTDDEFQHVEKYKGGDQNWRAVSLIPKSDQLVWGMDAGKDAPAEAVNKVYSLNTESGERKELAEIGNPAYHAVTNSKGTVLGVNFEPGRKQQTEEAAAIWFGRNDGHWQKLLKLNYRDAKRSSGSRYAYIYLPTGEIPDNQLLFTPTNVSKFEYQLMKMEFITSN